MIDVPIKEVVKKHPIKKPNLKMERKTSQGIANAITEVVTESEI